MRVFIVSAGRDTGGQGARIARAFSRHAPDWSVRAMHVSDTYIRYPIDLRWDEQMAQKLYAEADVVHHKNMLHAYGRLDRGQRKPALVHHHGSRLRLHPAAVRMECKSIGAKSVVSTVDLLLSMRGADWLPSPFDLDELAAYRKRRPGRRLRIVHSPTNRLVKSTAAVLSSLNYLARRYEFDVDIVEGMPWEVCLARKGRADIYIDQLMLGYGNNAIEAWAMGIPVVAGVADPAVRARMVREWSGIPFYEASEADLTARLEPLIRSASLREEWGARGRAHVERWHDERVVVERLKHIYEAVPPSRGPQHLWLAEDTRGAGKGLRIAV